jgi:hypothetical protein
MPFLQSMDSSDEADSTACYSNFFDDEEFILTFQAVTSDIRNHFRSTMSLQSKQNHSIKSVVIHCSLQDHLPSCSYIMEAKMLPS